MSKYPQLTSTVPASTTDKAGQTSYKIELTLLIVLRLTLFAGMDPPDMRVISFGIIPPPRVVGTVVSVNFAKNLYG